MFSNYENLVSLEENKAVSFHSCWHSMPCLSIGLCVCVCLFVCPVVCLFVSIAVIATPVPKAEPASPQITVPESPDASSLPGSFTWSLRQRLRTVQEASLTGPFPYCHPPPGPPHKKHSESVKLFLSVSVAPFTRSGPWVPV